VTLFKVQRGLTCLQPTWKMGRSDRVALLESDAPEIRKRVVDARAFELVLKLTEQRLENTPLAERIEQDKQ
jgi:hypothetical protein